MVLFACSKESMDAADYPSDVTFERAYDIGTRLNYRPFHLYPFLGMSRDYFRNFSFLS